MELASVRPFFHSKTYTLMSSQGNVKGQVFQKQAWTPFILMLYIYFLSSDDYVYRKLEKFTF